MLALSEFKRPQTACSEESRAAVLLKTRSSGNTAVSINTVHGEHTRGLRIQRNRWNTIQL